ncbi:uncharacterized protein NPIL_451081 [Nephila pilipes]|uniref:SHSP domain-containing protein n=1 Tax=Nephila pilipes TaxID=299642 RepID=A0A8X6TI57_NEPPI|nr:uncharacterized protein NPIL_451081 [Nephila pilipes]
MEYVAKEVQCSEDGAKDWWQTIKRYPRKLVDQDFGYQLSRKDLEDPEAELLKRKSSVVSDSGHLEVIIENKYFQVEFKGKAFSRKCLNATVENGFVVIRGHHEEQNEGSGTVFREFERHVMLPEEYNFGYLLNEPKIEKFDGYICITVNKARRRGEKTSGL